MGKHIMVSFLEMKIPSGWFTFFCLYRWRWLGRWAFSGLLAKMVGNKRASTFVLEVLQLFVLLGLLLQLLDRKLQRRNLSRLQLVISL